MKHIFFALAVCLSTTHLLHSQVVYSVPTNNSLGLFQVENGAVTRLPTGFLEHHFPAVSDDSRFIVFSSPDPVIPALGVPPSSDIYIFDRVFGQTRRVINTTTDSQNLNAIQTFRPLSAALSPNNQILAYGMEFTTRQGIANPQSGRNLIIASAANGVAISIPRNNPLGDSTGSEFLGISWDPGGNSFVTPSFGNSQTPLPGIWRVTRNGNSWSFAQLLSTPTLSATQGRIQIYPAISPSGAALAYFDVFFSDILGGSQPAQTSLIIANSNGSGAGVRLTFTAGLYPTGLAWSRDGNQLIFSVANQIKFGSAYLTLVDGTTGFTRSIPSFVAGNPTTIPGIGNSTATFPSVPEVAFLPRDTARPSLKLNGPKSIRTNRSTVVLRGKGRDNFSVARILAKARGAKVRRSTIRVNLVIKG